MGFHIEDIEKISTLMKLNFSQEEMEKLHCELNHIINEFNNMVEKNEFNNIDMAKRKRKTTILRKDEVENYTERERLFQNTRNIKDNHIVIPNIIEEI